MIESACLDPPQRPAAALREHERPAVGPVHVEPEPLLAGDLGDRGSGSTVPVSVVPPLPTTRNGRKPSARSRRIGARSASASSRSSASTGTTTEAAAGRPAIRAALATEWWVCGETYSRAEAKSSPSTFVRAAAIADSWASEPPEVSRPCAVGGRPNTSHSHCSTDCSIATRAGAGVPTPR